MSAASCGTEYAHRRETGCAASLERPHDIHKLRAAVAYAKEHWIMRSRIGNRAQTFVQEQTISNVNVLSSFG